MGLFFLPTLFVCSFSGCGGALLTGGLEQGRQLGAPLWRETSNTPSGETCLARLHQHKPHLRAHWTAPSLSLYLLKHEGMRPFIHFTFNFFSACFILRILFSSLLIRIYRCQFYKLRAWITAPKYLSQYFTSGMYSLESSGTEL